MCKSFPVDKRSANMCASSVIFQKTSQSKQGVSSPNLVTLPTWNGTAMTNFVTNRPIKET
jgi:hypothetical protein